EATDGKLEVTSVIRKDEKLEANIESKEITRPGNEEPFSFKRMSKNNSFAEDNSFHYTDLSTDQRNLLLSHLSSKQDLEFREEMVKLVSTKMEEKDSVKEAILKLHPDIPGEIRVKILLEGERLYIRLVVSNNNLRSFVESNLDNLKKSLIEKDFDLGGIDVYVMGNNGSIFYGRDRNNQDTYTIFSSYRGERETLNKSEMLVSTVREGLIDIKL
ncbi:MAG: flagellar hook-length control protein FliK, partial [bacterium]|nr:flagellar hook-length control protein FliK [bacterium]